MLCCVLGIGACPYNLELWNALSIIAIEKLYSINRSFSSDIRCFSVSGFGIYTIILFARLKMFIINK